MLQSTLCYLERGEEYLMLHRVKKKNDANHHKWIGIGGKFEDGESPEECILRETREETGLTLTEYRYRGLVTFVSDQWPTEYMHLFTATAWEGTPHPCDEGELAWIKKEQLLQLPLWEGDKIFLGLLEANAPFFSLKLRYEGEALQEAALNGVPISTDFTPEASGAILVSACLLGCPCRYDGASKPNEAVLALAKNHTLIPVCPEQLGGLPTPRPPAERQGQRVCTESGADVTAQYLRGAAEAVRLAKLSGCTTAILKERSPSCGCGTIYDGSFTRTLRAGNGTAAQALLDAGLRVLGESALK